MSEIYTIRETDDFYPLSVLFHDCGMEVPVSHETPEGMVKMWRMDNAETGELMAAVTLEIRDHVYVLGDLGVRKDLRNSGYGKVLQHVVFDAARRMGVKELWGSAKVPTYYYPLGWQKMDWNDSPDVAAKCTTCHRRGSGCHPEILKIEL